MIDRTKIQALRTDINKALKAIGEKHSVKLNAGEAVFTGKKATIQLEVFNINKQGEVHDPYAEEFRAYADFYYGIKIDYLGYKVYYKDKAYKITGLNRKFRKYPILMEREDGKLFKFTPAQVKELITNQQITEVLTPKTTKPKRKLKKIDRNRSKVTK